MLEVTKEIPDIIQEAPNQPIVILKGFQNNCYNFDLACVIPDVNKKGQLLSELNFAVVRAFQHHHIEMPSGQQDVRIIDTTTKK